MRKRRTQARVNFYILPLVALLWTLIGFFVWLVSPHLPGAVIVFLMLVFTALVFSLKVFVTNTRIIITCSVFVVAFLILGYFSLGNILNLFLLAGIAVALEVYWRGKCEPRRRK